MRCNRITIRDVWTSQKCYCNVSAATVLLQYMRIMQRLRKDNSITVRLTNEARQMLEEVAQADNRSAASWIENAIRRAHASLAQSASPLPKVKK